MISTKTLLTLVLSAATLTAVNGDTASECDGNGVCSANALPDGWKGGFKDSNPTYENGDVSDLPITGNLENIDKITRTQKILWPEFSWQSIPGDESSRVYEMFAKDVSRVGYDDTGRIWSIICPQRGLFVPPFGTIMIEVTVLGVRGWVDEPSNSLFGNIGIRGNIWIEPSNNAVVKEFATVFESLTNFPLSKENAIKIRAHAVGKPHEEFWSIKNGTDTNFYHPPFTTHWDEAFSVYNLEVEMGKQILTGNELVDDFNAMLLKLFNNMSGNLVSEGQRVAWNVWAAKPELVNTAEWKEHAALWFHSLTVLHEYPAGDPGVPRYADGTEFRPKFHVEDNLKIVGGFVSEHWDSIKNFLKPDEPSFLRFLGDQLFTPSTSHIKKQNVE